VGIVLTAIGAAAAITGGSLRAGRQGGATRCRSLLVVAPLAAGGVVVLTF